MTTTNKPKLGTYDIATRGYCDAHKTQPCVGMCRACLRALPGREARKGYVLGGWATRKEGYFYTFTHLATGMSVNVYPCHETKASALAHLVELAAGRAPQCASVEAIIAKHGCGWGGAKG